MSEIEVPMEQVQEHIQHHGEHSKEDWVGKVALSAALIAVMAAVAALLAGHHANEAMLAQIRASDGWNFFQAKGIKSAIIQSKMALLKEMGREVSAKDNEKIEEYKKEQDEISKEAKVQEADSKAQLKVHETLAKAVTFFQVAIAVSAISVLVKKKKFWHLGLLFGCVGLFFFVMGLVGH